MRTAILGGDCFRRRISFLCPSRSRSSSQELHYRYTPLEENQIRLLRLCPGPSESQIVCQLRTVDLLAYEDIAAKSTIEGWERYDAISYVWGDPKQKVEITCTSPGR